MCFFLNEEKCFIRITQKQSEELKNNKIEIKFKIKLIYKLFNNKIIK